MSPQSQDLIKLVHVTTVPQSLGFVSGQPAFLRARGFHVIGLSSPGESLARFAEREEVVVEAVPMTRRITPLRDLLALTRLWRRLRQIGPQIVHAHTPKGGLLGMIAAWLARVPVRIYHIHGLPCLTATGTRRSLLRWSEAASCRLAHRVLCVSHSIRDVAVAEGLCPSSKIRVLLNGTINGVDAEGRFDPDRVGHSARGLMRARYDIPGTALVVGFIGRLVRDKGLVELAEAWRTLIVEFPELHTLIVGPFESEDPLPSDVERLLKRESSIHLTGSSREVPELIAAMDVLVLPSYREGFPIVPLEAASMRLPVVATRIPGGSDAVEDGKTGTLVAPHDVIGLTRALRAYLADPDLRRRHGLAGRQRVLRDFRREAIWQAQYEEYLELIQSQGVIVRDEVALAV